MPNVDLIQLYTRYMNKQSSMACDDPKFPPPSPSLQATRIKDVSFSHNEHWDMVSRLFAKSRDRRQPTPMSSIGPYSGSRSGVGDVLSQLPCIRSFSRWKIGVLMLHWALVGNIRVDETVMSSMAHRAGLRYKSSIYESCFFHICGF